MRARELRASDGMPNHRRQRTPRFRSVCILRQWRGAAAAERSKVGGKEKVAVAGNESKVMADFQEGRWIEQPVSETETAEGHVTVKAVNPQKDPNQGILSYEIQGLAQVAQL